MSDTEIAGLPLDAGKGRAVLLKEEPVVVHGKGKPAELFAKTASDLVIAKNLLRRCRHEAQLPIELSVDIDKFLTS